MRYFDTDLVNSHPRQHGAWWNEVCENREFFHHQEEHLASFVGNASAILPRDAWQEMDDATRRIMRADEGDAWMRDLMGLAKPVNIGKLVHIDRVSSDAGTVVRSMSGQVPVPMDKVVYDYRGTPVPITASAFGREWREWNTISYENFDALSDDQEAATAKVRRDNALLVLNGDATLNVGGYPVYGIRTSPLSKAINLGSAAGGANIDLTTATSDQVDAFINQTLGAMLDANLVTDRVNLYISPDIARRWDTPYSLSAGFKEGSMLRHVEDNRRINKVEVSHELTGNQFFGFVPRAEFIRPLVAMATTTTAIPRTHPRANYQFEVWNALSIQIRGDYNGKSGVFYSTVVN